MGESERESETESERPLNLPLLCFSLPLSQMVSERGFCHQLFSPKDKGKCKVGRRGSGVGFGKGWERVKEGKREASGQYMRTRANFKAKHPKGGEKERREQNYWGTTFFFFFFSSFFFFSVLERVAKHDFYGIVLQSGSVKSVRSS